VNLSAILKPWLLEVSISLLAHDGYLQSDQLYAGEATMSYVVQVTMTEEEAQNEKIVGTRIHIDGKYEYTNLEIAREAAEVACHAAAKLKP
jgi:hypothetical protein